MTFECVGCGQVDKSNPPKDVMPRMVAKCYFLEICGPCKASLEICLTARLIAWCEERKALIKLDKGRRANAQN